MANFPEWLKPDCFDVKKSLPSGSSQLQINLYADFMELAAIANSSNSISYGEVKNAVSDDEHMQEAPFQAVTENDEGSKAVLDPDHDDEMEQTAGEQEEEEAVLPNLVSEVMENLTTEDGSRKNRISKQDHLKLMQAIFMNRKQRMSEKWPFRFDFGPDCSLIQIEFEPSHPWADKYLTLLLSGSQNFFRQKENNTHLLYSSFFEQIGLHVFRQIFPEPWVVKHMGAGATGEYAYSGTTAIAKVKALCQDIRLNLNTDWEPPTTGDAGMDLAAFYPFGDEMSRYFVVGQCACTNSVKELQKKGREIGLDAIQEKIVCRVHPLSCLLLPVSLADPTRQSFGSIIVKGVSLIDRGRILDLMQDFEISDEIRRCNQAFQNIHMSALTHLE